MGFFCKPDDPEIKSDAANSHQVLNLCASHKALLRHWVLVSNEKQSRKVNEIKVNIIQDKPICTRRLMKIVGTMNDVNLETTVHNIVLRQHFSCWGSRRYNSFSLLVLILDKLAILFFSFHNSHDVITNFISPAYLTQETDTFVVNSKERWLLPRYKQRICHKLNCSSFWYVSVKTVNPFVHFHLSNYDLNHLSTRHSKKVHVQTA